MADISITTTSKPRAAASARRARRRPRGEPYFDLIELLFFAYRDFVGDPDEVLAKLGFGRAHHRVLHFVNRNPGMKVADLLDVLKITKQSLGRVLKQLIDEGYVVQKEGASDRRQRLLYVSPAGEALAMKLAGLQTARIARRARRARPRRARGGAAFSRRHDRRRGPRPCAAPDRACRPLVEQQRAARATITDDDRRHEPDSNAALVRRKIRPTMRRICLSSMTTAAFARCCRAFCSAKAIGSRPRRPRAMRAPSSTA